MYLMSCFMSLMFSQFWQEGATDAARAAADIVLTEPGLGVIIDAIYISRKIFKRMKNYVTYRIACTIQLLLFFFVAVLAIHPDMSTICLSTTVDADLCMCYA